MESASLLNVLTVNFIPRNTPKVVPGFQVILLLLWFSRSGIVSFSVKYTAVFFSAFGILSKLVGCSDFMTLSSQLS